MTTSQTLWESVAPVTNFEHEIRTMAAKSEKGQRLSEKEAEARRSFLKRVGKATATAPAVALLLAASAKSASAQSPYAPGDSTGGSGSGSGSS